MEFSKTVRALRISHNLTQKELSKIMKVDQTTISTWEKGIRQPDYDTLKKLCIIFNVTSDYLLGLEDETGGRVLIHNSFNGAQGSNIQIGNNNLIK